MSAASNYLESKVIRAIFGGEAFPTITGLYVALHTSDPGDTGVAEVTTGAWPGYERQDAAGGGSLASGWTAESNGLTQNAKQMKFPVFDGSSNLTITHYSIWDAALGGNMICHANLDTAKILSNGDFLVIDPQQLTAQMT